MTGIDLRNDYAESKGRGGYRSGGSRRWSGITDALRLFRYPFGETDRRTFVASLAAEPGWPIGKRLSRLDDAMHEYEDIRDPDAVSQGDVLEWLPPHREEPWRVYGVVVTADCDLAWNKHGGVISYVPALGSSDYIWYGFRHKFFGRRHSEALRDAARHIDRSLRKKGEAGDGLSDDGIAMWLRRAGRDGMLDELDVVDAGDRKRLGAVLDEIMIYRDLLSCPVPDLSLLDRAFAMTGAKADRPALVRKIQESWSALPGDVFHLPSLPTGDEEGMFLMLRHIRQVPSDAVAGRPDQLRSGQAQAKRVARVSAPYRYAVTQNLARVFADIGLPDDHDERRKAAAQRFFDARS